MGCWEGALAQLRRLSSASRCWVRSGVPCFCQRRISEIYGKAVTCDLKPLPLRYNPKAVGVARVPVGLQLNCGKPHADFQSINVIHPAKVVMCARCKERRRANVRCSNPARLAGSSEGKQNIRVSLAMHDCPRNRIDAGADRNIAFDDFAPEPLSEKQMHVKHLFGCSVGKNAVGSNDVSGLDWWFPAAQRVG
jgi:hypothetical protein